jgi:hypothetical protein
MPPSRRCISPLVAKRQLGLTAPCEDDIRSPLSSVNDWFGAGASEHRSTGWTASGYGSGMGLVERVGDAMRRQGWFLAAPVIAAALAGAVYRSVPLLVIAVVYAVVNCGGVWVYCDHLDDRSPRTQTWLRRLAVALVPVGFVTVFLAPAGRKRREALDAAGGDLPSDGVDVAHGVLRVE